jgi:predicted metal-dependent hydrolase/bacterioferritin-associated ferredoxin
MDPMICFCNQVKRSQIEHAITQFKATNLTEIYVHTQAGVGPCGGSCKPKILALLSPSLARSESWDIPLELIEAASLFNRKYYWETHEVLEKVWLEENGELKIFYQGLIQAAAALYHVLNNNPKGVVKLASSALQKLQPFGTRYKKSIDFGEILTALTRYIEESKEILQGQRPGFDFDALPTLSVLTEES